MGRTSISDMLSQISLLYHQLHPELNETEPDHQLHPELNKTESDHQIHVSEEFTLVGNE